MLQGLAFFISNGIVRSNQERLKGKGRGNFNRLSKRFLKIHCIFAQSINI
ncbi:hypothetical protein NEISICOT_02113 [Neisseria sicca ATCC 29256]|uniref:Uncharacterized protein n=1 Tax=Neisseria sicca ATCC 29256 TaxID=547045 RepID=C6M6G1_NEISI|nr:hypothetical protein NEISICOT_02113 [Neisseria sicca ATCC 29256]